LLLITNISTQRTSRRVSQAEQAMLNLSE